MTHKILLRPESEADLLEAVTYYEENLKGLGTDFINSIETTLQSISHQPESFPIVYKNVRRALIKKFPFGIHYIIENNIIIVLAVFHFSRDPKNWKRRTE
jgi:plasmid stabilization system protein ParE